MTAHTHKRVLRLSLFLIPLILSVSAFRAQALTEGDYTFLINSSGQAIITDFNQAYAGELSITDTLGTCPVTSIGDWAFSGCSGLTGVTIPSGVTLIGRGAFSGCSGLTDVTIPSGVTLIWDLAFYGCSGLTSITVDASNPSYSSVDGVLFDKSQTTLIQYPRVKVGSYAIPAGVTSIGDNAFSDCSGLTGVTIPAGVTSIGDWAFSGCSGLTGVFTIPVGVTSIGGGAFQNCSGLTGVTIPAGVTSIGGQAFSGCSGMTNITIPGSVTSIGDWAFQNCSGLAGVSIPAGVTSIGIGAFQNCSGLTGVTIPAGVTSIGDSAFYGCSGLTGVTILAGVTSIGHSTFRNCSGLTGVTIPAGVTSIGDQAFTGCSGLTNITIPASVTSIGFGAFYGCSGLTGVTIPASVTSIGANVFSHCSGLAGVLAIPSGVTSIGSGALYGCSGLTGVTIPAGVTMIGDYAFYNCSGLTSVTIPVGVTSIGSGVFSGCSGLTGVLAIPAGVTSIGYQAFFNCSGLTGVTIPANVTSIGDSAFYGCSGLTGVTIHAGVTSIGYHAFYGCSSLITITVDASNPIYCDVDGVLYDKRQTALIQCPGGKKGSVTIPDYITRIGDETFYNCIGVTGVVIGNGVTSIGNHTFEGCVGLTGVTIGSGVKSIGTSAFYNCSGLANVTIPDGVTSIGNCAFSGCSGLTGLMIGSGVTSIGYLAFRDCSGLTSVIIPNSVISIGESAFYNCSGLTDVTIGSGVTSIGYHVFYNCSNLPVINVDPCNTSYLSAGGVLYDISQTKLVQCPGGKIGIVAIPVSVTVIEYDAFYNCKGLTSINVEAGNVNYFSVDGVLYDRLQGQNYATLVQCPLRKTGSVTIPGNVTSIDYDAFGWCSSLTSVTIPAGVTDMDFTMFHDCMSLTGIYFEGNAPTAYEGDWEPTWTFADKVVVYYLSGTTGWGSTICGYPTALWNVAPPPPAVPVPYVSDPRADVELNAAGSYDGYFYGGAANAVRGTLNVKVTEASNGKLTAKAALQKTALSFSATTWTATDADGTLQVTLTAKSGEKLDLYVRQNRVWGTLTGGALGGEALTLDGARNRFGDIKDTAAQALLAGFKGYYTIALPVYGRQSLGTLNAAPQGSGYLAVTVGVGGSAKIAGVLADGTKVSQASRLILFDGNGPEACVPFFSPLYSKAGWAGGLLWLTPGGAVVTDRDLGWYVRWEKPGSGPDGFSMLLDADGGYYGTTAALAAGYLFSADAGGVGYHYGSGVSDAVREALPEGVAVANAGGKLSIAKGVKPALKDGAYDYSGANSSLATLVFTPGTGLFKGKFNLYYDYAVKGKSVHTVVSVPYAGILTQVRSEDFAYGPAGQGHCLVPDNDPAVSVYKIKRSLPVVLEAE